MKLTLVDWLIERRDNCMRIAQSKSGEELRGWIEDLEYFNQAIRCAECCARELRRDKMLENSNA